MKELVKAGIAFLVVVALTSAVFVLEAFYVTR